VLLLSCLMFTNELHIVLVIHYVKLSGSDACCMSVSVCSDGSRENSRSSTDTASSVESSPCTGTALQSTGFSKDDQSS